MLGSGPASREGRSNPKLKSERSLFRNWQFAFRIGRRAELRLIKPEIDAFSTHQFGVGSDFSNPPFVENDDSIRMPDRGKSVSNDNGSPSL